MTTTGEYGALKDALQAVAQNVYIVNKKRPPTYERMWKVHVLWRDGTTRTEWCRDNENALFGLLRRLVVDPRARHIEGTEGDRG